MGLRNIYRRWRTRRRFWRLDHKCDCCHRIRKRLSSAMIPAFGIRVRACDRCLSGKKPKIG